MWFLYAIQDDQKKTRTLLRPGQLYTLGRKDVDILPLVIDNSISRRHATLKVEANDTENWKQADWQPYVWFHDLGSKYGSSIDSNKLEVEQLDQEIPLKDGSTIKIGTKTGLFQLIWEPLIICRQAMTQDEKKKLYNAALSIGAKITKSVRSSYTHLLMSNLCISYKVVRCLAEGKPIVSQNWLDTLAALPDTDFKFPPVSDYLPPIDESCSGPLGIPDFAPNPRRAKLFAGKRFIFFEEDQYHSLSPMVDACDGQPTLLNLNKADPFEEELGDENTIVITCGQLQDTTAGKNTINALDSFQRRTVDSMEICWAILYCSTDIQCNTSLNMTALGTASSSNVTGTNVEQHNTLTQDLPTPSEPISTPSTVDQPSPPQPLSLKQNHQPSKYSNDDKRTNEESIPKPLEEKELDLEDIFDQLLGDDEPSRPPPTPKHMPLEPSTSRTTTADANGSDSLRHQEHSKTPFTISPANQQRDSEETDQNITRTTARQLTPDSPDSFPQEEPSPYSLSGPSTKRKRTEEHQITRPALNKGKNRMYEPAILNSNNNIEPSADGDVEPASSGHKLKRRKARKTADDAMTDDKPSLSGRAPYTLPELENENVDIVPGKNYTKVKYIKMVVAPTPPADWATRQRSLPQSSNQINYKIFKKAIHPVSANPLSFVNMATEIHSNSHGPGERSLSPIENDYSDIQIRSNMIRRSGMRF